MIQTLRCQNGDHYYDREGVRGRAASSCTSHDGTGVPVKSYRKGSRAGELAFAKQGGAIKARMAPRPVPVRKVVGSDEGAVKLEEFPVKIRLTGTYKPTTSLQEQVAILRQRFAPAVAVALQAPSALEKEEEQEEDHSNQFWCEVGEHWCPRRFNRGRAPRICDDHKAHPEHEREVKKAALDSAEARGAAIATALIDRLRLNGTDLQSNTDRFRAERWDGQQWIATGLQADNWGVKHWAKDERNAHLLKIKRVRWVKIS